MNMKDRCYELTKVILTEDRDVQSKFPGAITNHGCCLYWAVCGKIVVELITKKRCIYQAGSCFWPRLPVQSAGDDDLACFGYHWEPNSDASIKAMINGNLPECHIWLAIPETNEIIDFSTSYFPQQCKKLLGLDWPGPKPPEYFWQESKPETWISGVQYVPNPEAITFAMMLIENQMMMISANPSV